ncbi:hypothetical protein CALVIDRAFT_589701 [Calocera viscosa TUFC12733]|uniref:DOP1 N-terminal domain-containing protein n=1 Tax=Calocera viscosa (strain TUFC12733) TaxID=1330018 RepID=A0A167GU00_CALVF|nr:hypothetical protein CALVIDRAFT_589701 [Calocera viscosa TUFC12733]
MGLTEGRYCPMARDWLLQAHPPPVQPRPQRAQQARARHPGHRSPCAIRRCRRRARPPAPPHQNLWVVLLTAPSARSSALNYLSRRLPKLKADEDITSMVGHDLGLMVRAFAASLDEENLLVRRGIMDILVQSLPVDSLALKKRSSEDRLLLMKATVSVVLRRDLSLNRRLYAWLLGSSESSETQVAYFCQTGLGLLEETLKVEMSDATSGERETRPYKIFISLLEKSEIGIPLTERLCLDALRDLK